MSYPYVYVLPLDCLTPMSYPLVVPCLPRRLLVGDVEAAPVHRSGSERQSGESPEAMRRARREAGRPRTRGLVFFVLCLFLFLNENAWGE